MGPLKHLALLAVLATSVYAIPDGAVRKEKSIGIFNIVKFPNDVCESDMNAKLGTCFTAEECTTRNGIASGDCADGYGVCCLITLTCGGTSSTNCTHLTQMNSATPDVDSEILNRQCSYTICPASATVNRIRLDFTTFDIAGPVVTPVNDGNAVGATIEITNCLMDRFTVTGTAGPYPIICGVNNGQHMIVDTDGTTCVTAVFSFGRAAANRGYDIHVTQYDRLNAMGGPPKCLQFFTAPDTRTGTVSTFNWQGNAAGGASTHLALQRYDICVRPERGFCVLCWSPTGVAGSTAAMTVGTFGVSNGAFSGAGTPMSGAGPGGCPSATDSNDFVIIPNGVDGTVANIATINMLLVPAAIFTAPSVFCGRYLNGNPTGAAADGTICTRSSNFRLGVRFDNIEAVAGAGMAMENIDEASGTVVAPALTTPLGTQGFELAFIQQPCN